MGAKATLALECPRDPSRGPHDDAAMFCSVCGKGLLGTPAREAAFLRLSWWWQPAKTGTSPNSTGTVYTKKLR